MPAWITRRVARIALAIWLVCILLVLLVWVGRRFFPNRTPVLTFWSRTAAGDRAGLYVVDIPDGQPLRLYDNTGDWGKPVWSPDGRYLAIGDSERREVHPAALVMNPVTGQALVPAPDVFSYDDPVWSPDGVRLAFGATHSGRWDIYVVDVEAPELPRALDIPRVPHNLYPVWVADSRRIAFSSGRALYIMDGLNGALLEQIDLGHDPRGRELAWTPDPAQDRLAFIDVSNRLYLLDLSTGKERRLYSSTAHLNSLSWSPDGRWLVFVAQAYIAAAWPTRVMGYDLHADEVHVLSERWTRAHHPVWSPDGEWLAYLSNPGGGPLNQAVHLLHMPTGARHTIPGSAVIANALAWWP